MGINSPAPPGVAHLEVGMRCVEPWGVGGNGSVRCTGPEPRVGAHGRASGGALLRPQQNLRAFKRPEARELG